MTSYVLLRRAEELSVPTSWNMNLPRIHTRQLSGETLNILVMLSGIE